MCVCVCVCVCVYVCVRACVRACVWCAYDKYVHVCVVGDAVLCTCVDNHMLMRSYFNKK